MKGEVGTKERKQHSEVAIDIRQQTTGGIVTAVGWRDTEHSYLDYLVNRGYLGKGQDAVDRYDTGMRLRSIYYRFHKSGKCVLEPGTGNQYEFTSSEESDGDLAEQEFHAVMKALPSKYRMIVQMTCCDADYIRTTDKQLHEAICDGLDALYGAFIRVDSK